MVGYCADIGEITRPPTNWDHIEQLLDGQATSVHNRILSGSVPLVVLRYRLRGRPGVLALSVFPVGGGISARAYRVAATGRESRLLRAGPSARKLTNASVCIVGCGAVGSFLADILTRNQVGQLTLRDGDFLLPGNLIRHFADEKNVGRRKPSAIKQTLANRGYNHTEITADDNYLLLPADALAALDGHDIVVDASADGPTTALLHRAAESIGTHIVSVCLVNGGSTVRIDILPPPSGAAALPPTASFHADEETYELGCGSPISPASPQAVLEAATIGARHVIDRLTGVRLASAGEVRELAGDR